MIFNLTKFYSTSTRGFLELYFQPLKAVNYTIFVCTTTAWSAIGKEGAHAKLMGVLSAAKGRDPSPDFIRQGRLMINAPSSD
jgi:hypothetical protein